MRHTIIDASQLELSDKVVTIKRVTKTVKGGRNMRFTALVVVGDGNGHVGAGLGKAVEIPEAIRKGKEDAMKKLVTVAMDENKSVTHDFLGKFKHFRQRFLLSFCLLQDAFSGRFIHALKKRFNISAADRTDKRSHQIFFG